MGTKWNSTHHFLCVVTDDRKSRNVILKLYVREETCGTAGAVREKWMGRRYNHVSSCSDPSFDYYPSYVNGSEIFSFHGILKRHHTSTRLMMMTSQSRTKFLHTFGAQHSNWKLIWTGKQISRGCAALWTHCCHIPLTALTHRSFICFPIFLFSLLTSRSLSFSFSQQRRLHIQRAANEVSIITYSSLADKLISWVHSSTTGDHGRVSEPCTRFGFSDEKVTNTKTTLDAFRRRRARQASALSEASGWTSQGERQQTPQERESFHAKDSCIWTAV